MSMVDIIPMVIQMQIRKYTDADFNCVANIYNAARPDEFYGENGKFKMTPWAEDEYMMSILTNSEIYLYQAEAIWGSCGFTGDRINWLFVDPAHRGKGVGHKLLSHVLSKLKNGASLSVWKSNKRAKSLYLKQGFEVSREFYIKYQGKDMLVNTMVTRS